MGRLRRSFVKLLDVVTLLREARCSSAVVMSTVGLEATLYAWAVRLVSRRTRILLFDFLAPRRRVPRPVARLLFSSVHGVAVIRSGDIDMLNRRFGIRVERCSFVAWPVDTTSIPPASDGEYVYSAGWAHRDWPTLVQALRIAALPAKLAPGRYLDIPSGNRSILQVSMPSPEEGRLLMAASRQVALVMNDTDLPSGPLVLLDAMGAGKAVVVTDVNGTRDYVVDHETALVVPPEDPEALADALLRIDTDEHLRQRLGETAREFVETECAPHRFWESIAMTARTLEGNRRCQG